MTPLAVSGSAQSRRVTVRRTAVALGVGLFLIYNANGREIGSVDTIPTKYAAREFALSNTLRLGRVVAERPEFAQRESFAQDREHNWRSAYSPVPAIIGGLVGKVLRVGGLVDLRAPLASNLIAAVTASTLTSLAVVIVFLALTQVVGLTAALLVAIGLGLGTNYWPLVSRALNQQEVVAFGSALALWAGLQPDARRTAAVTAIGGIGLGLAGAARPQAAPLVAAMAIWLSVRDRRHAGLVVAPLAAAAAASMWANYHWFGSALGAVPRLEAVHRALHHVDGSLSHAPWIGALGLLVSPSRGILIFSPVVVCALVGMRPALARRPLRLEWLLLAAALEFSGYAMYSVWWGGHTFGPRYLVDDLVPLTPFAAIGCADVFAASRLRVSIGALLFAWSVAVAAMGAFVYPNDGWNSDPVDVDTHHERLWAVRDSQIVRAMGSRPSPQNFRLFTRAAVRADDRSAPR